MPGGTPTGGGGNPKEASVPAPAYLTVSLPADAKLLVDAQPTTLTSASRTFVTPELAPGRDFHYTLTAEMVRNGQTLTATEVVQVRAGTETQVEITPARFVTASVVQK